MTLTQEEKVIICKYAAEEFKKNCTTEPRGMVKEALKDLGIEMKVEDAIELITEVEEFKSKVLGFYKSRYSVYTRTPYN